MACDRYFCPLFEKGTGANQTVYDLTYINRKAQNDSSKYFLQKKKKKRNKNEREIWKHLSKMADLGVVRVGLLIHVRWEIRDSNGLTVWVIK